MRRPGSAANAANRRRRLLCAVGLVVSLGSAARAQQPPQFVPNEPFKTVHLIKVRPGQKAALLAAVGDFNREFVKQGCPTCAYHVFRMFAGARGKYNYMMTSDWPGRDVYIAIHNSAAYDAADKRNPIMARLGKTEFYGRYVEVK